MGPLLFLLFINELPDVVKRDPENDGNDDSNHENDEIIVYADDNTPITASKDPAKLQAQIQHEANVVTEWFSRNDMVCSSDKTKLLIIGTHSKRHHKLEIPNLTLKVNVCGEEKTESNSEKLLSVIVNKYATFKNHFYGDEENQGLVKQLSSRVGVLKRL